MEISRQSDKRTLINPVEEIGEVPFLSQAQKDADGQPTEKYVRDDKTGKTLINPIERVEKSVLEKK